MKLLRSLGSFFKDIFAMRKLIFKLAKNDFKSRYAGSYFGFIWSFIQSMVTILVYWFVFEKGLRAGSPIGHVPYALWFMTGIIPWFYFFDAFNSSSGCLIEYSYLVKKVVFKISILPIVKLMSSLFMHLIFVGLLIVIFSAYGFEPSVYYLQFIYYTLCMIALLVGLSLFTSSVIPFFKDLGQIISIILQFGMWLTPIVWSASMLPHNMRIYFKLNPLYYIIEGYRDTFIKHVWFYNRYNQTAYFWTVTILMLLIGAATFKRLKPHFADVL